jgi:TonB-linked SusC/RagA family outer membrane protein
MKQRYQFITTVLFSILLATQVFAQQRTINGTVKDSEGNGMPGVNVIAKGTSNGTTSDTNGNYTISVNQGDNVLVFSFIGYATQEAEIGNRTTVDVTLTEDITELNEVVVTALGVERNTKALQYSVTEVSGDNFTQARENNLGNALSGRVAGVNVNKISSGPAGSTRIVIRGNKTLGGQNQPLYVVDGIPIDNSGFGQAGLWGGRDEGDGLNSINPDDIESITVLKGANASALYGSRGGNGVINIVTKKGAARKGVGIEFNSNYVFETVMNLSDVQTKYGSGNYVDTSADGVANGVATRPDTPQRAFNWGNIAWGPAFDGGSVVQFDGVSRPYSYQGDNWKRFYERGDAWTNSLSLSGGSDKQSFRFSIADLRSDGVLPNSGFDRTNVTMSTTGKYFEKLTLNAKVMYSHEEAHNRPVLSDSPGNAVQSIWRIPGDYNVESYKGDPSKLGAIPAGTDPALLTIYGQGGAARQPGQELLPAANNWGQNPYWASHQFINDDIRDRFIASGQLRYDITKFLYASGRIGMDWFTRRDKSLTPQGTGYQLGGALTEGEDRVREINMEWMLGTDKSFGKINVNAFIGGNRMRRSSERISADGNGFNVAFEPFINNAATRNFGYGFSESGINSLFGSAEVSYDGYLFLTGTWRKDWWSVLNSPTNNLAYPSIGGSFVFSDAFNTLPSWLSFGKVRASWAQTGFIGDLNPYDANLTYSLTGASHLGRPMASFSQAMGNSGTIPNPALKPAKSTEIELGFDLRGFDDRIGIDFTYYTQRTTDDIVSVTVSRATGFGSTKINVGELKNNGVEIQLYGTPIRSTLVWDVSLNLAKNVNEVVKISDTNKEITLEEPRTRNVFIKHIVGEPFGTITGRVQQRTPDGTPLFMNDGSGRPLASTNYVPIGNGLPDWTGGLNNSLHIRGLI